MKRLLLLLAVLFLAGCPMIKLTDIYGVQYRVTGTAPSVDITYATDGGGSSQRTGQILPWYVAVGMHLGGSLYISAQNAGATGSVTVSIYQDEKLVKTSTSTGAYVIATASDVVANR